MASVLRIGLTGGIASGKSTVARLFAALGVPVIDTDVIAREVVAPGTEGLAEIVAAFGAGMLKTDGSLDRRRLRKLVFADAQLRKTLEAITHPRIRSATLAAAATAGGPYQLLVVPLLLETGFARHVDRVLVVDCSEEQQLERLLARDGGDATEARRILDAQMTAAERCAGADDLIRNDADLAALERQVAVLHQHYLELAGGQDTTRPH